MLHSPGAHEAPSDVAWDAARVRAGIRTIVEDAEAAFADGWLMHPADREPDDPKDARPQSVYLGGAGVVQALTALERRGLADLRRDYLSYLDRPFVSDIPDRVHPPGLLLGELGIRLVRQRLSSSSDNADRIAGLVAANVHAPQRELMWGAPARCWRPARCMG